MPDKHKWDDGTERQLLLEVIMTTNLTIPMGTWATIATAMGDGYTAEGCRQKYQQIKRKVNGDADKTATPKASRTTAAKPAKTPPSASKGKKRKANHPDDDDDEEVLFAPKSRKIKKEKENGVGAEVFKVEEEGEGAVDLERDDLYDAVA